MQIIKCENNGKRFSYLMKTNKSVDVMLTKLLFKSGFMKEAETASFIVPGSYFYDNTDLSIDIILTLDIVSVVIRSKTLSHNEVGSIMASIGWI